MKSLQSIVSVIVFLLCVESSFAVVQDTINAPDMVVTTYYLGGYAHMLEAENSSHGISFSVGSETLLFSGHHKLLSVNIYTFVGQDTAHVRWHNNTDSVGYADVTIKNNVVYVTGLVHNSAQDTLYVFNLTGKFNRYEASSADFCHTFDEYNIDDSYLKEYSEIMVDATDDENAYLFLEFNLPKGATGLVPGEYPILYDLSDNTVLGGSYEGGEFVGSFAGYLSSKTTISTPLWFMVDGMVIVTDEMGIEVEAVNSEGRSISCCLRQYPEAIENVEKNNEKPQKLLRNGQLIIKHNGKSYTIQGKEVPFY